MMGKSNAGSACQESLRWVHDSIMVNDALHFEQIAAKLDFSVEELRDLNPQYRADVIPAGFGKSYALKMPYNHIGSFIDNQDSILYRVPHGHCHRP